jgi:hypothetical protein
MGIYIKQEVYSTQGSAAFVEEQLNNLLKGVTRVASFSIFPLDKELNQYKLLAVTETQRFEDTGPM